MPGKPLSDIELGRIDAYRASGKSIKEISVIMGRNRKTIARFMCKWRQCLPGETPSHKVRSGRKQKINEKTERIMKKVFLKSPRKSIKALKREYPDLFHGIAVRTIRDHACRRLNFKSRVAKKKPLLTPKHMEQRLKFARLTKDWTVEQWRKVIWSDEASFKVCGQLPQKVRRPLHRKGQIHTSPYQLKYCVPTTKFPKKIMIWGSMSGNAGRGSLVVIPKGQTVTADSYLKILQEKLEETMEIHDANFFMQDGAPVHTAKKSKTMVLRKKHSVLRLATPKSRSKSHRKHVAFHEERAAKL